MFASAFKLSRYVQLACATAACICMAAPSSAAASGGEKPTPTKAPEPAAHENSGAQTDAKQRPQAASPAPHTTTPSTASRPQAAPKTEQQSKPIGLSHAIEELACDDADRVEAALAMLATQSSAKAGTAIARRIHDGLPPKLLLAAVDALVLGKHKARAGDLVELLGHRRAEVRLAVVQALGALGHKRARTQLSDALNDPDSAVQQAAVTALLGLGDRRAVPALLAAHDRGVKGAIEAVGELASADQMNLLLERAKGETLDPVAPALDRVLRRPKLTDGVKIRVIRAVSNSPSPNARKHLTRWLDEGLVAGRPRLARELSSAIQRVHTRERATTEGASATTSPMATMARRVTP